MSRPSHTALGAVLSAAAAVTALVGCGSQTKTVSVAGAPAITSSTSTSSSANGATGATATGGSGASAGSSPTTMPSETRTATEPAFAHAETQAEGLSQALSVLHERGFQAVEVSQYHAAQTLRVLVGSRSGAAGGNGEQAFFFIGNRYLGTDTKEPSATVEVLGQGDTEVTLGYSLYRAAGAAPSATGARATVRFQLDDGKLTALDPIPPASSPSAPSRL